MKKAGGIVRYKSQLKEKRIAKNVDTQSKNLKRF
jgi:hypothetical protein